VVTPRKVNVGCASGPYGELTSMFGTLAVMSPAWRTPRSMRSVADRAVIAIGTSCRRSTRRCAVTTISSRAPSSAHAAEHDSAAVSAAAESPAARSKQCTVVMSEVPPVDPQSIIDASQSIIHSL
jgi:hypothetical protein